jgi:hypothetical protein
MATNLATSLGLVIQNSATFSGNEGGLRTVQIQMSNQQLAEKGLLVLEPNSTSRIVQQIVGFGKDWNAPHPFVMPMQEYSELMRDRDRPVVAKPGWLPQFDERLRALDKTAVEDEIDPSSESRVEIKAFAGALRGARMPGIALVGNGNYRLRWKNKTDEVVGLQFRGNGEVQYLFFKRVDDRMEHMLGTKLVSTIQAFIAACGMRHVIAA